MLNSRRAAAWIGALLLSGCGGDSGQGHNVEIKFAALVGEAPFSCTQSYMLGTPASMVQPRDLRLYVYDVALVRASGEQVKVTLAEDGHFQRANVALLDFEDRTGTCAGTLATNTKVVGSAPEYPDYTGLHFRIGVPSELNHLDEAKQAPPLNLSGLFWSWQDGYIQLRSEWQNPTYLSWQFLLAESIYDSPNGCKGSDSAGYTCPNSFQPIVELANFDRTQDTVKLDLAALFQGINFQRTDWTPMDQLPSSDPTQNTNIDYQPGCHS
ncbi:MAG TPA: MbnP family copper-binding protein, partial [Polyangiaceae bacterium]|nr:MbnP family copper-binding protein [Polyangiaceae bacterium]